MNYKNQIRYIGNFGNYSNMKKGIIISLCFVVALTVGLSVKYIKDNNVFNDSEITTTL